MTNEEVMRKEIDRCQTMLADVLEDIEVRGGNIRFFATAFLSMGVRFYAQVEDIASLERAIRRLCQEEIAALRSNMN